MLSGRYRLESKLGSGGMSTVFLARDETLERWVAVKVMHREISDQPDQIERFRREARAVAQLSHPNVVAVIDAGEDGGYPYIVLEYVEGETLKQRIDRLGRLPVDEAAAYAIEIGRGLAAAHARRLVHRDVKPQNVLIDAEGRAKVTDFGIARSLESDGLTKTGRVLGTTDYVAPEQAMGHGVDSRSDIYSLGVLLYEMLTGEVPFRAETRRRRGDEARQRADARRAGAGARRSPRRSPRWSSARPRRTPRSAIPTWRPSSRDLEGALEVEVARSGASYGQATNVLDAVPSEPPDADARRVSAAGIVLVLAAVDGGAADRRAHGRQRQAHVQRGRVGRPIPLKASQAFDPDGDNEEHSDEAHTRSTPTPTTAWTTETYRTQPGDVGRGGQARRGAGGQHREAGHRPHDDRSRPPSGGWDGRIYASLKPPDRRLVDGRARRAADRHGERRQRRPDDSARRDQGALLPDLDHQGLADPRSTPATTSRSTTSR